jgi:hypothetical protein
VGISDSMAVFEKNRDELFKIKDVVVKITREVSGNIRDLGNNMLGIYFGTHDPGKIMHVHVKINDVVLTIIPALFENIDDRGKTVLGIGLSIPGL